MKRKAFPHFDLSIAFETSSRVISEFNKDESKGETDTCSSFDKFSKSTLNLEICSRNSSSKARLGSSLIPLKHSEKSLYHFNRISFLSLLIVPSSRMISSSTWELFLSESAFKRFHISEGSFAALSANSARL